MTKIPDRIVKSFLDQAQHIEDAFNRFAADHLLDAVLYERKRAKLAFFEGALWMLHAVLRLFREELQAPPEDAPQPVKRPH